MKIENNIPFIKFFSPSNKDLEKRYKNRYINETVLSFNKTYLNNYTLDKIITSSHDELTQSASIRLKALICEFDSNARKANNIETVEALSNKYNIYIQKSIIQYVIDYTKKYNLTISNEPNTLLIVNNNIINPYDGIIKIESDLITLKNKTSKVI